MERTEKQRSQYNEYHRNYNKANRKKIIEINQRFWLRKAEELAADEGSNKLAVISGVGVREYYRKFGYEQDGPYVSKALI